MKIYVHNFTMILSQTEPLFDRFDSLANQYECIFTSDVYTLLNVYFTQIQQLTLYRDPPRQYHKRHGTNCIERLNVGTLVLLSLYLQYR